MDCQHGPQRQSTRMHNTGTSAPPNRATCRICTAGVNRRQLDGGLQKKISGRIIFVGLTMLAINSGDRKFVERLEIAALHSRFALEIFAIWSCPDSHIDRYAVSCSLNRDSLGFPVKWQRHAYSCRARELMRQRIHHIDQRAGALQRRSSALT